MRFFTINLDGKEKVAVGYQEAEELFLLEAFGLKASDMNELIVNMTEENLALLRQPPAGATPIPFDRAVLCAPIPRPRQDVVCLGLNYFDHAKEAAKFSGEAFGGERPATIYFSKRVNEAVAPGGTISAYGGLVDSLDYEAELGVILGKDAKGVPAKEAFDYIFGYTIINDVSARNLQTKHKQWYLGKSLDGFTPMGPCIVTPDDIGDPEQLELECYVNGELRQKSSTAMLMKTIPEMIEELSAGMTLLAGTIIATGTPAGVGMGMTPPAFLKEGDKVECRIEKIGSLLSVIGK